MSGISGIRPNTGTAPTIQPQGAQVAAAPAPAVVSVAHQDSAQLAGQGRAEPVHLLGEPVTPSPGASKALARGIPDRREADVQALRAEVDRRRLPPQHRAMIERVIDSGVSATRLQMITAALTHLGKPYRWGATGPKSFDCSGFAGYVYKQAANIELPRVSANQARAGTAVAKADLQPGDLVFFGSKGRVTHVGIYVGTNGDGGAMMINAPNRNGVVRIESLWRNYTGARRLLDDQDKPVTISPDMTKNMSESIRQFESWVADAVLGE